MLIVVCNYSIQWVGYIKAFKKDVFRMLRNLNLVMENLGISIILEIHALMHFTI